MTNPILRELHKIRKQILDEHREDLVAYLQFEVERAEAAGHPVAKIKRRTLRCTGEAKVNHWQWRISRSCPVIDSVGRAIPQIASE